MNENEMNNNNNSQQESSAVAAASASSSQDVSGFHLPDCENRTLVNNINYLTNQFGDKMQNNNNNNHINNNNGDSFKELTSNMLNNTLMEHQRHQPSMLGGAIKADDKDNISLSFSNLNINDTNDKFWSLDGTNSTNQEFSNTQSYPDSSTLTFTEQSLVQKNSNLPNQMNLKMPMNVNYGSVQTNLNRPLLITQSTTTNNTIVGNNNNNNNSNSNSNNVVKANWSRSPQVPTTMHSNNLTWSNAFTSTFPTVTNSPNTSNAVISSPNAWPSAIYNHQKRSQLANINCTNQPATIMNKNKPIYNNENQFLTDANQKFRRSTNLLSSTMKNYPNSTIPGQSNIYELGSAGSDNTSSSSDSANLRENGLFFHDKNFEQNPVLDSFRNNLDPQLCDVLKTNPEANKNMFNYPALHGRFNRRRGKSPFFTGNDTDPIFNEFPMSNNDPNERFSRKVFVGGLPPDIDEEEITASFRRFGHLVVDWPHKAESKSYFPPKGYAFLLFQDESSVQMLIDSCYQEQDKLYLCVSSPTMKDKPVQIRPWRLSDADYVLDASMPLDPRKTVFVGGVPRPLKAVELAMIMDRLYGGVCYAGIDTDPELKYPKGAGRVAFSNQQSYIAAISARFVQLQHADIEKRVEVKPYVLDDQICDECQGIRCNGKFAPYFCANITCLQYYCETCWANIHARPGREFHKPLVKEGADRPRAIPFRWC